LTPFSAVVCLQESAGSFTNQPDVNYGKFYNTTYLEKSTNYKRGPSINSACKKVLPDKHMPENFSFSQVRSDFIRPMKKESSSMMSALGDAAVADTLYQKHAFTGRRPGEPYSPIHSREVIKMQHFPSAQREKQGPLPIEREDWPAPPAVAAAYPELLRREGKKKRRRRVRPDGTLSENETDYTDYDTDASVSSDHRHVSVRVETEEEEEEDEDEEPEPLDPKTQREVDELEKMKDKSGAAKMVLLDLERKRAESPVLEPISASRAPAADHEPELKTRYDVHIFASPSRDLEYRPRLHSMDDILDGKKYRNASLPIGNFPVERRPYELPKSVIPNFKVPKPGYGGRRGHRTVTLPIHATRNGGYHSDIEYTTMRGRGDRASGDRADSSVEDLERRSYYTDVSDYECEYDPETGLRRSSRLRSSAASSDGHYIFQPHRRSIPSIFKAEEPPVIYPYDQLKMSNYDLPPGVERSSVERHLSKEEFESIFHMNRQEFYRLAEWKRNDLKKRVGLF